jgi:hypothetical protein
MDRKSTEKLRLDRRLIGRKNGITPKEHEREIQALPDVSHKIAEVEEESDPDNSRADCPEANPPDAGSPIADSSIPSQS